MTREEAIRKFNIDKSIDEDIALINNIYDDFMKDTEEKKSYYKMMIDDIENMLQNHDCILDRIDIYDVNRCPSTVSSTLELHLVWLKSLKED